MKCNTFSDEIHHGVTAQYQRIVRYFHSKFLLGLTATPDRKHTKVKDLIREEFLRVESQIGHRPSRMELFTLMDDEIYGLCRNNSKDNIFRNYLAYLDSLGRLTPEEKELYGGPGRDFLHLLETTSMTKVYKMSVLRAFYNGGAVRMAVTEEELLAEWKAFFGSGTNWKDLRPDRTYQDYLAISDKAHLSNILSNPVHFLQKSGNGFFVSKEGYALAIREDLKDIVKMPAFARQMGDIIDCRTMDNYEHFVLIISKPPVGGLSLSYRIRVRPRCARLPPSSDKIYYQRRYRGSLE